MRTTTRAVHAGREDFSTIGCHAPPIDLSSTYPLPDASAGAQALTDLVEGRAEASNSVYARLHNPTVARFERALAELEHAPAAVSFSSGMAAITALLLAARARGNHIVAARPIYGTTDHLIDCRLLGLDVDWVAPCDVGDAIRHDTALVLIETPGNPTLSLIDIESVVEQAGDVPVAVDSTFATPILQNPLRHGARFVVHSATKFIGGHGDVIAGIIACGEKDARALRQVRIATGALLHPLAAYLLHRGLPTLPLRVLEAQRSAKRLATRLADHPAVRAIRYPQILPGSRLARQMRGPGTIVGFEVQDADVARQVMESLRLITPAVSLGSVDTLIQHPCSLTHQVVSEKGRKAGGIMPGLLRLSVGLEDADDLWEDLQRALDRTIRRLEAPSCQRPTAIKEAAIPA